jgi:hypothetical protein
VSDSPEKDYQALNELIVNCPELSALESELGSFNLFSVLRSEFAELKHSNVLAWLFDPTESHGLDAAFLQKWLMRVLHKAHAYQKFNISPVEIDAWNLLSVEVRREWLNIDLLLILTMADDTTWVVCIENKVHSTQSHNQLKKYRERVEKEFPKAAHRLYLFLRKSNEQPHDEAYLATSYTEVYESLTETVKLRDFMIGDEPRVLINNYLRLLRERFMNESDIAKLATKIYQNHKRAIDLIIDHRPQNLKPQVLPQLVTELEDRAEQLAITMAHCQKNYVRLVPKAWDIEENKLSSPWGHAGFSVIMEIDFSQDQPRLMVVTGRTPEEWNTHMKPICDQTPPFTHLSGQHRSGAFARLYSEFIELSSDSSEVFDVEKTTTAIADWVEKKLQTPEFQQVIDTIAQELPLLASQIEESRSQKSS